MELLAPIQGFGKQVFLKIETFVVVFVPSYFLFIFWHTAESECYSFNYRTKRLLLREIKL